MRHPVFFGVTRILRMAKETPFQQEGADFGSDGLVSARPGLV